MQNRLTSKTAWLSLAALIIFVLKNYFDIELENGDELVGMITAVLVAFGIFNNPTQKDKY